MADVCKPPVALFVKRRLIRAASLQVVIADEFHVAFLHLLLSEGSNTDQRENCEGNTPFSEVLQERRHIQTPSTIYSHCDVRDHNIDGFDEPGIGVAVA